MESISIHALLAESDDKFIAALKNLKLISIHALLAESDTKTAVEPANTNISIHALLAESDCTFTPLGGTIAIFLSTLSLRRATPDFIRAIKALSFLSTLSLRRATVKILVNIMLRFDFYPRSPCGERRRGAANCYLDNIISIHALLAESDSKSAQNSGALLRI